jgi:hypothetical protein
MSVLYVFSVSWEAPRSDPYSPECVEGKFSEVRV